MAIFENTQSPLLHHDTFNMDQVKLLTVWSLTTLILLFGLAFVKDLIAFVLMKLYQIIIQKSAF
jgi:hypothetical protein